MKNKIIKNWESKNKTHFEHTEFVAAFSRYRSAVDYFSEVGYRVSLISSFHEYSDGFWIEVSCRGKGSKLSKQDILLQCNHHTIS